MKTVHVEIAGLVAREIATVDDAAGAIRDAFDAWKTSQEDAERRFVRLGRMVRACRKACVTNDEWQAVIKATGRHKSTISRAMAAVEFATDEEKIDRGAVAAAASEFGVKAPSSIAGVAVLAARVHASRSGNGYWAPKQNTSLLATATGLGESRVTAGTVAQLPEATGDDEEDFGGDFSLETLTEAVAGVTPAASSAPRETGAATAPDSDSAPGNAPAPAPGSDSGVEFYAGRLAEPYVRPVVEAAEFARSFAVGEQLSLVPLFDEVEERVRSLRSRLDGMGEPVRARVRAASERYLGELAEIAGAEKVGAA